MNQVFLDEKYNVLMITFSTDVDIEACALLSSASLATHWSLELLFLKYICAINWDEEKKNGIRYFLVIKAYLYSSQRRETAFN